jgi:hypothetical protein
MAINYTLNWSDDTLKAPFTLVGGSIDTTTTSLALTGKSSINWGERVQENLLRLLENSASNGTPPSNPTPGQLWYNAGNGTNGTLSLYTTAGTWVVVYPVSGSTSSTSSTSTSSTSGTYSPTVFGIPTSANTGQVVSWGVTGGQPSAAFVITLAIGGNTIATLNRTLDTSGNAVENYTIGNTTGTLTWTFTGAVVATRNTTVTAASTSTSSTSASYNYTTNFQSSATVGNSVAWSISNGRPGATFNYRRVDSVTGVELANENLTLNTSGAYSSSYVATDTDGTSNGGGSVHNHIVIVYQVGGGQEFYATGNTTITAATPTYNYVVSGIPSSVTGSYPYAQSYSISSAPPNSSFSYTISVGGIVIGATPPTTYGPYNGTIGSGGTFSGSMNLPQAGSLSINFTFADGTQRLVNVTANSGSSSSTSSTSGATYNYVVSGIPSTISTGSFPYTQSYSVSSAQPNTSFTYTLSFGGIVIGATPPTTYGPYNGTVGSSGNASGNISVPQAGSMSVNFTFADGTQRSVAVEVTNTSTSSTSTSSTSTSSTSGTPSYTNVVTGIPATMSSSTFPFNGATYSVSNAHPSQLFTYDITIAGTSYGQGQGYADGSGNASGTISIPAAGAYTITFNFADGTPTTRTFTGTITNTAPVYNYTVTGFPTTWVETVSRFDEYMLTYNVTSAPPNSTFSINAYREESGSYIIFNATGDDGAKTTDGSGNYTGQIGFYGTGGAVTPDVGTTKYRFVFADGTVREYFIAVTVNIPAPPPNNAG